VWVTTVREIAQATESAAAGKIRGGWGTGGERTSNQEEKCGFAFSRLREGVNFRAFRLSQGRGRNARSRTDRKKKSTEI